ncbi:MAG TPA: hypothetical protein VGH73_19120 [Thermoanaerobaculia bacterium]
MEQSPSSHLFVVHPNPEERPALSRRMTASGRLQPLEGTDALLLSLPADRAAKPAWDHAREIVGAAGTVQPVLLDQEGEPHYPTGEISVRFAEALGDQELQRFAAEHGLRLLRRNEFVSQQAVFQPLDASGGYLPEIVERLEREEGIRAAWANTLSRYRRAS